MSLNIRFNLKRAGMCMLLCMLSAAPALADICFLPTGACESGAMLTRGVQKSCEDYVIEGIYYDTIQNDMNCSMANIPGCTLYECTAKSCESRNFKLGPTSSAQVWPSGFNRNDWQCEYCQQGTRYRWKCSPLECPEGYHTVYECQSNEIWQEADEGSVHKAGSEPCGVCRPIEELQCAAGLLENIPTGCKICVYENNEDAGVKSCYRCKDMEGYQTEADYMSTHDGSCYDFKTKQAADGQMCYKGTKKGCPDDQYLEESEINGKTVCKCRDYEYTLAANPYLYAFTASGGTTVISVESYRIGIEKEPWDYEAFAGSSGICSFTKSGDKITVTCAPNTSSSTVSYPITLAQNHANGADVTVYTIGIDVAPDHCPNGTGSLENNCPSGTVGIQTGTSVAGQPCYTCQNNQCPAGYTEGEPPADTGYDITFTDSGKKCYKVIEVVEEPDTCPTGYDETITSCNTGYRLETADRNDGVVCGKCVSESCPIGKDCTDDPVCPNGKPCDGKVDCTEIAVGDSVKYYDCKCKPSAIRCGDGYTVDEENCGCNSTQCPAGYDERITSCDEGWELDTPNGKAGDLDCNRCKKKECPGDVCQPWKYCLNNTSEDCTPNPDIECDETQIGSDKMYYNCECKITASSCKEGQEFDSNRCQCRDAGCPEGYNTAVTGCTSGYEFKTSGKSGDKDCGKCVAKTCPSGQTCTTDKICPNGSSCPDNPDVKCDSIMLGDEAKVTNCKCNLSGTKSGYTLDTGNCKWVPVDCPAGSAKNFTAAECPLGDTGGYHITELVAKSGEDVCKRCDANTCPSGKSCSNSPVNPGNGSDATGNDNVKCTKIKLGATWAYYDCTCTVSDSKCGNGKKANTTACTCEGCEGKLQTELNGPMTCEKVTCGGQTRYKNCSGWGSQWQLAKTSDCNSSKLSDDGRTYYNTSETCQCTSGYNSSSCDGKCQSTEKCVSSGTKNADGATCYTCKSDACPNGLVKDPSQCGLSQTNGNSTITGSAKAVTNTAAGSPCFECVSTCTPGSCGGYPYEESNFIKSSTDYYEECDPGCGNAKKYKCKDGATASTQPNGKTVCAKSGSSSSTDNTKANCDKNFPSSSGWEYLGADQKGMDAANKYMQKYPWPDYKYEIKQCSGTSHLYGRHYSTVCNIYTYCSNASSNMQCYQTNQVFNMESLGYCCDKKGSQTQVNGYYGTITSVDEYCCYAGENCPISRVATSVATDDATKKCGSKAYVPKDQMSKYTKACGDSHMVPNCSSPSSDADYVCCTCTQRPS